jgi:hypothetical protein
MHVGYWWRSEKERGHYEDQDIGGWTILKWILERDRMGWYGLDRTGSEYGPMEGSCEHGDEFSGSLKILGSS